MWLAGRELYVRTHISEPPCFYTLYSFTFAELSFVHGCGPCVVLQIRGALVFCDGSF